jgi:MerR family mercuric resistance operon transcriptional regulator
MEKITIGKLAKISGVGVETVRFYQKKELLREPASTGAIRTYTEEDAQKIIFIKKAQELGFSLAEIKELLELNTKPRTTCANVKTKAMAKIKEIEHKIENLHKIKKSLVKLSTVCDSTQDKLKQYKVQDCFDLDSNCNCN